MTLLSQKIPTSSTGVFYKDEIGRDKQKTIGKYSQGIRIQYCKVGKSDEIHHK